MSDSTIQGALQTIVQALSSFDDADVTLGDFQVLGRGSPPYAIIVPGGFRAHRAGDWSQVTYEWTHYVEVWDRFTSDDFSSIIAARQAVVDQLNSYPSLGGLSGVAQSTVTDSSDLIYLWLKGQGRDTQPAFVGFRLTVSTIEEVMYAGSGEFT